MKRLKSIMTGLVFILTLGLIFPFATYAGQQPPVYLYYDNTGAVFTYDVNSTGGSYQVFKQPVSFAEINALQALGLDVSFLAAPDSTNGLTSAAVSYQDWWWNPAQGGMGVNVGQQGNTIFAAWSLYGDDGKASFLSFSGTNPRGDAFYYGNLYRNTGPSPGPGYNPALVTTAAVGSASIFFTSDTAAILRYSYDNGSHAGTLGLERYSFARPAIDGTYQPLARVTSSGCNDSTLNGTGYVTYQNATLSTDGNTLSLVLYAGGDISRITTFTANYSQAGSVFLGSGTVTNTLGYVGTFSFRDLTVDDDLLSLRISSQDSSGPLCHHEWVVTGIKTN